MTSLRTIRPLPKTSEETRTAEKKDQKEVAGSSKLQSECRMLIGKANGLLGKIYKDLWSPATKAAAATNLASSSTSLTLSPSSVQQQQTHTSSSSSSSASNVCKGSHPTSPRTLRSHSPRHMGCNLTNGASPQPSTDMSQSYSCRSVLNFESPKEAPTPRSPLKVDVKPFGQSSTGLVSPIWPSSLEVGMEVEIDSDSLGIHSLTFSKVNDDQSDISLQESSENMENPCFDLHSLRTPVKRSGKRKISGCTSHISPKKARSPSPQQKTKILRKSQIKC